MYMSLDRGPHRARSGCWGHMAELAIDERVTSLQMRNIETGTCGIIGVFYCVIKKLMFCANWKDFFK